MCTTLDWRDVPTLKIKATINLYFLCTSASFLDHFLDKLLPFTLVCTVCYLYDCCSSTLVSTWLSNRWCGSCNFEKELLKYAAVNKYNNSFTSYFHFYQKVDLWVSHDLWKNRRPDRVFGHDEVQRRHEVFDTFLSDRNWKRIDCLPCKCPHVSMCVWVVIWTLISWLFVCNNTTWPQSCREHYSSQQFHRFGAELYVVLWNSLVITVLREHYWTTQCKHSFNLVFLEKTHEAIKFNNWVRFIYIYQKELKLLLFFNSLCL